MEDRKDFVDKLRDAVYEKLMDNPSMTAREVKEVISDFLMLHTKVTVESESANFDDLEEGRLWPAIHATVKLEYID